jgi:hypothetical protein
MDVEHEIYSLSAETFALQTIITQTLARLSGLSPEIDRALRDGFDDAANVAERLAIHFGKAARPEHTVKALRIVEELRTVVFGDQDKPKHAV